MGPVGPSPSFLGLVQLNMCDDHLLQIELFSLGIVLQIVDQSQQVLDRLLWPPALGPSELNGLAGPSNSSVEPHEGNALLVLEDLSEVPPDLLDGLSLHHFRCLVGVLEMAGDLASRGLGVFFSFGLNRVISHGL